MSKFTTKKLPSNPKIDLPSHVPQENEIISSKKKVRKFIAIFLVILGCIFWVNYVVQGIWNIKVGTAWDNTEWKAPIFEATGTTTPPVKKW